MVDEATTRRWRGTTLTALLTAMALIGPAVAYAGVSVVWPDSTKTVNVNQDPPIRFFQGSDFDVAKANNFTKGWTGHNTNASYEVTISGLSGGNLTIDQLLNLTVETTVTSYKINVSEALTGALEPDVVSLKLRVWDEGLGSAPTSDGDASVDCVLELKGASAGTASGSCDQSATDESIHMQLHLELAEDATATDQATVKIRPSDVALTG